MALLAYTQWSFCPTRNRLRAHYEALLDAYREAWLHHLGLEGIEAASTLSRQQYRECDEACGVWLRHCKQHGCQDNLGA
jgi:hypothetical protein